VAKLEFVPPAKILPLLNQRVGKFVLPTLGTRSLGFWYCVTGQSDFRTFVESRSHATAQANGVSTMTPAKLFAALFTLSLANQLAMADEPV
jgi:hypothetical protein